MPGFDERGPMGYGPMTGRGLGPCGRGMGFRRGLGRGFRRFAPAPSAGYGYYQPTKEEEVKILEADKADIEAELKQLEARLKELKGK